MKLIKGYMLTVKNEDWRIVSKTLNLHHRLIIGPIHVMELDGFTRVSFEYGLWNSNKMDMVLASITYVSEIHMDIEEI